jgi:hypothetical protein
VRYPDVEKYFRMDIATCKFFMQKIYGLEDNPNLNRVRVATGCRGFTILQYHGTDNSVAQQHYIQQPCK